jgi:hypothetical protein
VYAPTSAGTGVGLERDYSETRVGLARVPRVGTVEWDGRVGRSSVGIEWNRVESSGIRVGFEWDYSCSIILADLHHSYAVMRSKEEGQKAMRRGAKPR